MDILITVFLKIAEMGRTAGIVFLVVLMARLLLRGLPKRFAYILWVVVAFRLMIPDSVGTNISIFNYHLKDYNLKEADVNRTNLVMDSFQPVADDARKENDVYTAGHSQKQNIVNADADNEINNNAGYREYTMTDGMKLINILALVWLTGILVFTLYTIIAHNGVRRRIRYSIWLCDNVYECGNIRSPFVFGLLSPRIYIPFRLNEKERQCVLMHERYHIMRKDYWIKSLAYILAVVYWFHPLVWAAFYLMCIDMEMSCDEKIISGMSMDMRKEYGRLLLAFASNKRQMSVGRLAFGEENTMKRIKNILNYKRPSTWKITVGIVVMILTLAACGTDAKTGDVKISDENNSAENHTNMTEVPENVSENGGPDDSKADSGFQSGAKGIDHRKAQWAENSMFDYELCTLDYADEDTIIFHISSGLFQYDLQEANITGSLDLKTLNCQEVQTGGKCRIKIYQDESDGFRAAIIPYPYSDADSYIYDFATDELFAYDDVLLGAYRLFDGLVSKWDLEDAQWLQKGQISENVLNLGNNTYGVLMFGNAELRTMRYQADGKEWVLFQGEQATLPKLLKQDDSFYQSFALNAGKDIGQCVLDYSAFYRMHDYAGICALSTGVEYSDEMQEEWSKHTDMLSCGVEVERVDGDYIVFEYSYTDENGKEGAPVYITFRYIEGQGWRAHNLPTERKMK